MELSRLGSRKVLHTVLSLDKFHEPIDYGVVADDPEKGLVEENLIVNEGTGEPCKHLTGNGPGNYCCAVHDRDWYSETPCFDHTQIESKNSPCRMENSY